jgi:hypothetical protein
VFFTEDLGDKIMKKRFFALLTIFLLTAVCVFPIPLEYLIPSARATQLRNLEQGRISITETQLKNPAPALTPYNNTLTQLVNGIMNTLKPNMLVEALYLYSKPEHLKTDSGSWDDRQKVKIFNHMTAVNTLTGIQYYSSSRKAMRTFYEYSNIIDSPVTKKPLPDPVFTQPPASLTIYARQKDLTFGDNIYCYDYVSVKDAIIFTQENMTSLNYGIIPIIGKGNLRTVLAVFDCGDSILIYTSFMTKAASLPGLSDQISDSFINRAQAVLHWFSNRLNKDL